MWFTIFVLIFQKSHLWYVRKMKLMLGLFICVSTSTLSSSLSAETRELFCDADQVFPKRKCLAEFEDGVPHGTCRAFDDKGRLILTEDYVHGKVQGKRVCYYPSGKRFSEMTFVNGLAEGETTFEEVLRMTTVG